MDRTDRKLHILESQDIMQPTGRLFSQSAWTHTHTHTCIYGQVQETASIEKINELCLSRDWSAHTHTNVEIQLDSHQSYQWQHQRASVCGGFVKFVKLIFTSFYSR